MSRLIGVLIGLLAFSFSVRAEWTTVVVVADSLYRPIQVLAGDFQGLDSIEVVVSIKDNGYIGCAYDYISAGSGFTGEVSVSGSAQSVPDAVGLSVGDADGDAYPDIIGTSWQDSSEGFIGWWENDGGGWDSVERFATGLERPLNTAFGDIDDDGDDDIVATIYEDFTDEDKGELVWYENPTIGVNTSWTYHLIDEIAKPYAVAVGDLDYNNTDKDIVITTTDLNGLGREGVYIYHNTGSSPYFSGSPDVTLYENYDDEGSYTVHAQFGLPISMITAMTI